MIPSQITPPPLPKSALSPTFQVPLSPFHSTFSSSLSKPSSFGTAQAPTQPTPRTTGAIKQRSGMLHPSPAPLRLWDLPGPLAAGVRFGSPAAGTAEKATSSCRGHPGGCCRGPGAAPCCSSGSDPGAAWCSGSGCTGASSAPMPKHCCPCGSLAAPAPWMERDDAHPPRAWNGEQDRQLPQGWGCILHPPSQP